MTLIPVLPDSAPFTAEQRAWLNGYLAALTSGLSGVTGGPASPAAPKTPLLILWGSQTGSAHGLAKKLAKLAAARGFEPSVVDMANHESVKLASVSRVLIVTSTYGDGEPPDNAVSFWEALSADSAARLEGVKYSVLALGDRNYSAFCEFGKKVDERIEALGATRVHPRTDCDVDYDGPSADWMQAALAALPVEAGAPGGGSLTFGGESDDEQNSSGYSKTNPYKARLLTNRLLNGEGSGKEVRHIEISLNGSGLTYEAGDALGVWPANCPDLVDEILAALECSGEEPVKISGAEEVTLRVALRERLDITKIPSGLLDAIAEKTGNEELRNLLSPDRAADLAKFLKGREIIDLLVAYRPQFSPGEFVGVLKRLQPRLYSISSSPKAHPGEVHLTMATVRYETHGRTRKGVCSTFLADRAADVEVPVFVHSSPGFRPPQDGNKPVIMIGPGTGIAPFRAFLEERKATGASGRNWLFFGDQRASTDFYYREELEQMTESGVLTKLSTAFSRDQEHKIYVQDRMLEAAAELWKWLEEGAHVYVCGDASRMAKDVDTALHKIIETAGGMDAEGAAAYVKKLKADKRYQRDVY